MPILTKAQLEALNQSSFPDQSTEAITPQILREYNTATIDSLVDSLDTGSFIQDLTSLNTFTASQQILNAQFADTGSNTFNGNQVIVGAVTASTLQVAGLDYPTVDNGALSYLQTDGAGNLSFQYVNSILENVRYGENITIGDPLYVSGSNGTRPVVWRAQAGDTTKMPVIYIATSTATANTNTTALTLGDITGVTTTGYPAGTVVYVGEAGGWSATRPSGSASIVQPLGIVTKEGSGGSGRGLVLNPGPATLPNLQTGYVWAGNGGNQPTAVPTSSFGGGGTIVGYATTGSNTFVGNQTISNDGELNGIFFRSGSEFFVGQRSNGNFSISSSAENRIIDINPSSGWIEVYSPQTNFNQNVSLRGTTDARNINTTTGLGFVAQFDGFTASLQEGYAWVGKSGGTSVSVPTSSFAGAAPVGVATTGSNTFTGSQYIDGGNKLYIQRDTAGAQQYLRLGATDNTYNFAFIVTGSDTNPGQQVWGINTAGGIWANSFDAGVVFNSYVTASNGIRIGDSGTFSAPLQQGYVWAGDSNGRTQAVPTSSFGGGGSTFPYTGDAQITGSLGVSSNITASGEIRTDSRMYVFNQYGGIDIQQNAQGSGSQYPGMSMKVAPNTYPTDIFGGFTVLTEQGALAGSTYLGMVANSYSSQYSGTTVPMIIANGNNPGGNDTAIVWKSDGTAEHWKKSSFKYGVELTGSVNLTPASVSTSAQYPLTFISGSTISKDSVDTLVYNPSTNQLLVSASTGTANISPNAITFTSGSGAYGTYASTVSKVQLQSSVEGGGVIGISGNPSKIGAPSLTSNTNPGILALSSSAQPYVAIELQNSSSFTDGRVTIKRPLVVEQGITGSVTVGGNFVANKVSAYNFDSLFLGSQMGGTTANGTFFGYGSTDYQFIVGAYAGGFDSELKITADNTGITFGDFNGSSYPSWLKLSPNTGANPSPIFTRGLVVTGSANVSGSINAVGTITANNGLVANNSNITAYGGGLAIQANAEGSGSAYAIATATVDAQTDPTNVYSAFQLVEPGGNALIAIAANSYTGEYPGITIPMLFGGGNNPNSSNAGIAFPANGQADHWKKSNFKYGVDVTGSVSITETMKLKPQNPLPSGTIGELAVSGSSLYFYDGTWRQVSLV